MKIIDRYVLAQFVQVFFICFLSLAGLYIVIDAFGHLDDFITYSQTAGSLLEVMGQYYAYRSVALFDRLSGVLVLIAAMFTVTWIQRHQELTALLAAGVRTFRVITPIIVAAVVVAVLAAMSRELIIPQIRDHLARSAQDLAGTAAKDVQQRYDHATDLLLRGKKSYADQQRIELPSFILPGNLDRHANKHLVAENAFYEAPTANRPGGYRLTAVSQPENLCREKSLVSPSGPIVLTPVDCDWLKPDECFVVSEVNFDMLAGGFSWQTYASTRDLIDGLHNKSVDYGVDVRVAIHSRVLQPLLDVTLLFLGLPLVLSRGNRNVFLAIGMCVGIAVLFMAITLGCQYMGKTYFLVTPDLGAWLPLMIFVPVALAMSDPLRE